MKIKYKNYIIEDDRNSFILRETGITKEGENKGNEYEKEAVYPNTLKRAFEMIIKKEKLKKDEILTIEEYIKQLSEIQDKFISDIKLIIN